MQEENGQLTQNDENVVVAAAVAAVGWRRLPVCAAANGRDDRDRCWWRPTPDDGDGLTFVVVVVGWIPLSERRAKVGKSTASFDALGVDDIVAAVELVGVVDDGASVGGDHRMVNSHCYCTCRYRRHLQEKQNVQM